MKKKIKIIIFADDISRLLSRVLIIFNRRNLFINSINISQEKKILNVFNYVFYLECIENKISNLIKQIDKLIGVIKVFYVIR